MKQTIKKSMILILSAITLLSIAFIMLFSSKTVKAENQSVSFSMQEEATIRLDSAHYGIRFRANVDPSVSAQYRIFIVPTDWITAYAQGIDGFDYNNFDYIAQFNSDGREFADMGCSVLMKDGEYYVQGSLTSILYNNMDRSFFGLAYYTNVNGERVYADFVQGENEKIIGHVASKELNKQQNFDINDKVILDTIIKNYVNRVDGKPEENKNDSFTLDIQSREQVSTLNGTQQINQQLDKIVHKYGFDIATFSSDTEVATTDGLTATSNAYGNATITALVLGNSYTYPVYVQPTYSIKNYVMTINAPEGARLTAKLNSETSDIEINAQSFDIGEYALGKMNVVAGLNSATITITDSENDIELTKEISIFGLDQENFVRSMKDGTGSTTESNELYYVLLEDVALNSGIVSYYDGVSRTKAEYDSNADNRPNGSNYKHFNFLGQFFPFGIFTDVLDGNGYSLTYDQGDDLLGTTSYPASVWRVHGLFYQNYGKIKNLAYNYIERDNYTASNSDAKVFLLQVNFGIIEDCYINAYINVSGYGELHGLIGSSSGGVIKNTVIDYKVLDKDSSLISDGLSLGAIDRTSNYNRGITSRFENVYVINNGKAQELYQLKSNAIIGEGQDLVVRNLEQLNTSVTLVTKELSDKWSFDGDKIKLCGRVVNSAKGVDLVVDGASITPNAWFIKDWVINVDNGNGYVQDSNIFNNQTDFLRNEFFQSQLLSGNNTYKVKLQSACGGYYTDETEITLYGLDNTNFVRTLKTNTENAAVPTKVDTNVYVLIEDIYIDNGAYSQIDGKGYSNSTEYSADSAENKKEFNYGGKFYVFGAFTGTLDGLGNSIIWANGDVANGSFPASAWKANLGGLFLLVHGTIKNTSIYYSEINEAHTDNVSGILFGYLQKNTTFGLTGTIENVYVNASINGGSWPGHALGTQHANSIIKNVVYEGPADIVKMANSADLITNTIAISNKESVLGATEVYSSLASLITADNWLDSSDVWEVDDNNVYLYGKVLYAPNTYRIIYNLNGGTQNSGNILVYIPQNGPFTLLDPTREGYTFDGWYIGEQKVEVIENITKNVMITAKWSPIAYKITYLLESDATHDNPDTYTTGSAIVLQDAVREGYIFKGWQYLGQTIASIPYDMMGDIELVAKWEIVKYYVTYKNNGGLLTVPNPTVFNYNSPAISLNSPSKMGYTFDGWYLNGQKISVLENLSSDVVLEARYNVIDYTITYILDQGVINNNPTSYNVETEVVLTNPTKDGYVFKGWNANGSDTVLTHIPKGNVGNYILTASWDIITHSVTYDLDGGTVVVNNPTTYSVNSGVIVLNPASKVGYTFIGWYLDGVKIENLSNIDKNVKIIAKYSPINYSITYDVGENGLHTNPTTYTIEDKVVLTNPTREGYAFSCWLLDSEVVSEINVGNTGDKKFIAVWSAIPYTITYVLNGGANDITNPTEYFNSMGIITLKSPTKDGAEFTGWLYNGKIINELKDVYEDVTLVAVWGEEVFDITYTLNGGSVNNNPTVYTKETTLITLNAPIRDGYEFVEWQLNGKKITSITSENNGDLHLVAVWGAPIKYSITYVLNGGDNSHLNPNEYTIQSDDIILEQATKEGYRFTSWTLDGVSVDHIKSNSFGNKTLVANFELINYAIEYQLSGGENSKLNPDYYNIENGDINLASPTKDGYVFTGWTLGEEPISKISAGSFGVITLKATWTAMSYNIIYNITNDVVNSQNVKTYTPEQSILLQPATRTGYKFIEWQLDGKKITQIDRGTSGDLTLTPVWEIIEYVVMYKLNGGVNAYNNPLTYTINDSFTLNDPIKIGCEFNSWTIGGETVTGISKGTYGDLVFTAIWDQPTNVLETTYSQGIVSITPTANSVRYQLYVNSEPILTTTDTQIDIAAEIISVYESDYVGEWRVEIVGLNSSNQIVATILNPIEFNIIALNNNTFVHALSYDYSNYDYFVLEEDIYLYAADAFQIANTVLPDDKPWQLAELEYCPEQYGAGSVCNVINKPLTTVLDGNGFKIEFYVPRRLTFNKNVLLGSGGIFNRVDETGVIKNLSVKIDSLYEQQGGMYTGPFINQGLSGALSNVIVDCTLRPVIAYRDSHEYNNKNGDTPLIYQKDPRAAIIGYARDGAIVNDSIFKLTILDHDGNENNETGGVFGQMVNTTLNNCIFIQNRTSATFTNPLASSNSIDGTGTATFNTSYYTKSCNNVYFYKKIGDLVNGVNGYKAPSNYGNATNYSSTMTVFNGVSYSNFSTEIWAFYEEGIEFFGQMVLFN